MTELLNKFKLQEQSKATIQRESCLELTNTLQQIVNSQLYVNGLIPGRTVFDTQCPEFDAFRKKINSDLDNKIKIKCHSSRVNFMQTHVDIKINLSIC